jgi:hypothetical protein
MGARKDVLTDPVFGTLIQGPGGLFWEAKYASRKFGRLSLSIRCDGAISDAQRNEFKLFTLREDEIFKSAQEYLHGVYNRYRASIENDPFASPEEMVQLELSEQIWEHWDEPFNGGSSLHVLYSREHSVFLQMAWSCSWDVVHGTSICIENGRVVNRERWLELQ